MPAPTNRLKERLKADDFTSGLWLSLANAYCAELAGSIGFDWVLIDGEHAPNDIQTVVSQLQALATSESSVVVRPPIGSTHLIKQYLDIGVQSLLIPMVDSVDQARDLVRAVQYPPHGVRGVGASVARASMFGKIADYMENADQEICLMLQIESRAGLDAIDGIAALDGVDCLFIGPADLSADMGFPGNPFADEVQKRIEDALVKIKACGKAAGIYMTDPVYARRYRDLGANFIAVGSDAAVLSKSLRELKKSTANS